MDYSGIRVFDLLKSKMDYLGQRQAVLARSVSMIDTPGFKGQDLEPFKFGAEAASFADHVSMRVTSPMHQQAGGSSSSGKTYKGIEPRSGYELKPVGNSVSAEDYMMKINETAMDYQAATNLYGKVHNMFKTAIGNR